MSLSVLDLFSGVGGFSLGLERTQGFKTVAFCEIEPFCRRVLAKHWPDVPIYEDVRDLTAKRLEADGIGVDVICGGFPCQDISNAGRRVGIEGDRSGLWAQYARLIGELRPRYAIVENVAALLGRGMGRVLGDLAALGYDAEWHCIPASAVGAHHQRDRIWIVANAHGGRRTGLPDWLTESTHARSPGLLADAPWNVRAEQTAGRPERKRTGQGGQSIDLADTARRRWDGPPIAQSGSDSESRWPQWATGRRRSSMADAHSLAPIGVAIARQERRPWEPEPRLGRVAHGVPDRVDRLRALGNAVVPQVVEALGQAILTAELAHAL